MADTELKRRKVGKRDNDSEACETEHRGRICTRRAREKMEVHSQIAEMSIWGVTFK